MKLVSPAISFERYKSSEVCVEVQQSSSILEGCATIMKVLIALLLLVCYTLAAPEEEKTEGSL